MNKIFVINAAWILRLFNAVAMVPFPRVILVDSSDKKHAFEEYLLSLDIRSTRWVSSHGFEHLTLFLHEMVHVKQYRLWGTLEFWALYLISLGKPHSERPIERAAIRLGKIHRAKSTPDEFREWFENDYEVDLYLP